MARVPSTRARAASKEYGDLSRQSGQLGKEIRTVERTYRGKDKQERISQLQAEKAEIDARRQQIDESGVMSEQQITKGFKERKEQQMKTYTLEDNRVVVKNTPLSSSRKTYTPTKEPYTAWQPQPQPVSQKPKRPVKYYVESQIEQQTRPVTVQEERQLEKKQEGFSAVEPDPDYYTPAKYYKAGTKEFVTSASAPAFS